MLCQYTSCAVQLCDQLRSGYVLMSGWACAETDACESQNMLRPHDMLWFPKEPYYVLNYYTCKNVLRLIRMRLL